MPTHRSAIIRTISILLLSLAATACSAAVASTAPGPTSGGPTGTASLLSMAPISSAVASSVTPAGITPPPASPASGIPDCSGGQIGRKAFKTGGFDAQLYCGPATASVTASGVTGSIASGWCETNAAGFAVSIGTQLFGSPNVSQEPDLLIILVNPTTGAGSISGVVSHHGFLLTSSPIHFGASKLSGTFSGQGIVGGTVSGSFKCS